MNTSKIRAAIANREIIEFTYKGHKRKAEPHIYGIKNGKRQLLVYQIGGTSSSGPIPDWRRIDIDVIGELKNTGQKFQGKRDLPSSSDSGSWDTIIARVE